MIGGCCGTTPAQIAAIRGAIDADRAADAAVRRPRAGALRRRGARAAEETQLARMLRGGEFVVSVQLDPPLGADRRAARDGAAC